MPKRWDETIDAHRHGVRDAILHATGELVADRGLLAVTMSEIAERSQIGRATLYRYFPDVEAILLAWHEWQIAAHLAQLTEIRDRTEPARRLDAVLQAYALLAHESHGQQDQGLAAFLHRDGQVDRARDHVRTLVRTLIAEGVASGIVRSDVASEELATYCIHSLSGAARLRSKAAVRRLVRLTLDGLRLPS